MLNPESADNTVEGSDHPSSNYEALYQQAQAEAAQAREAFAQRLEPSPETEQFKQELAEPRMIEDSETGLNCAVYELNRDKTGKPLVVNLAWSVPAESGVGRADLSEFTHHLTDRPIVVIDMEATGKTDIPERAARKAATFESLAASHLRALDQLGIKEFDLAGYSLGGVMAAGMAAQAGERVGHLITMAAPGFEDISLVKLGRGFALKEPQNSKAYLADAAERRPAVLAQETAAQADTKDTITTKNVAMLLKLASLMTKEATADAIAGLSAKTKWTDVVGSRDAVTDWTGHLEAVRVRNAAHPHSSTEHVLGSETHSMGIHRPAMAEVLAQTLAP